MGNSPDENRYDLLSVIFVGLSKEIADERDEYKLHRLLETFFSSSLSEQEKREVIEHEYGITYSKEIGGSVNVMCNVSDGLVEQGIEQGLQLLENAIILAKKEHLTTPQELIDRGVDARIAQKAILLAN